MYKYTVARFNIIFSYYLVFGVDFVLFLINVIITLNVTKEF